MEKQRRFLYLFVIPFFLGICGCARVNHTLTNEEKAYAQTEASRILITTQQELDQEIKELGFVTTTQSNIKKAKKSMRKQAAKYGGDAIIDFKVTVIRQYVVIIFIPIAVDNYICRGRVVKFVESLNEEGGQS